MLGQAAAAREYVCRCCSAQAPQLNSAARATALAEATTIAVQGAMRHLKDRYHLGDADFVSARTGVIQRGAPA